MVRHRNARATDGPSRIQQYWKWFRDHVLAKKENHKTKPDLGDSKLLP